MRSYRPNCSARLSFTVSSFLFVLFVYVWFTFSEVQFAALRALGQSAVSNLSLQSISKPLVENSTTLTPDMRVLVGILTVPDQYQRRHFLRLVYGTQSPLGAQVDVKFVLCNLTREDEGVLVALEIMCYNDIIILSCKENMNKGKTYAYFSSLPEMFDDPDGPNPPYDYVMKADDDVYLRLDKLVESLRPLPREDLYYGYVIPCESMEPYSHYMSGMAYLISWDVVEYIRTSEFAKNHNDGPEDKSFGSWVRRDNRTKNRYNAKWSMYNYPDPPDKCTHDLWPETIAVHLLQGHC